WRAVVGDHGTCGDEGIRPDLHPRANAGSPAHTAGSPQTRAIGLSGMCMSSHCVVVGRDDTGPEKGIVLDLRMTRDVAVGLDSYPLTDDYVVVYRAPPTDD